MSMFIDKIFKELAKIEEEFNTKINVDYLCIERRILREYLISDKIDTKKIEKIIEENYASLTSLQEKIRKVEKAKTLENLYKLMREMRRKVLFEKEDTSNIEGATYRFKKGEEELFVVDLFKDAIRVYCQPVFSLTINASPNHLEIRGNLREIARYKELKEEYKLLKGKGERIELWHNLKLLEELRKIIDIIGSLYGLNT
jgi:hypothetical protein